jgi:hypothetical protein
MREIGIPTERGMIFIERGLRIERDIRVVDTDIRSEDLRHGK